LLSFTSAISRFPFVAQDLYLQTLKPVSQKSPAKTKSPRIQVFWHVGFGISFCTEVLDPQQPQARNVLFATATAAAATTHSLARHFLHYLKRVRGIVRGVNTNP
jgi:hypothetical protein